jgi:hypothetical protein
MQSAGLTHEVCSRAIDRLLYKNEDFNSVLKNAGSSPSWVDESFPFPQAVYWDDMRVDASSDNSWIDSYADWTRLSDAFSGDKYSLWGEKGIEPGDVNQGGLGDCWLHAAAASVAGDPKRIKKLFEIEDFNTAGVYALNMYVMGIPVTVTVDEYVAMYNKHEDGTVYGHRSPDHGIWNIILEKAAAKLFGNYEMLSGGWMGPAV